MAFLAPLIPILGKSVPYLVILVALGVLMVCYARARVRRAEDKMRKEREQSQNTLSQLQSVKRVEESMAQAQAKRLPSDELDQRFKDGTF